LLLQARAYAEQLADLALWLGDLGLQSDASLLVGEAYYNMQKYGEAEKWHRRSFEYSQKINSLEVSTIPGRVHCRSGKRARCIMARALFMTGQVTRGK
jgi:hypothetical protein